MDPFKKKEFIQAQRQRKKFKNYENKTEKQILEETEDEDLINAFTNQKLSTNYDSSDSDPLETQKEEEGDGNDNVQILNTDHHYKLFKTSSYHLLRNEWNQLLPNPKLNVPPPMQIQVKSKFIEPKSIPRDKFESLNNNYQLENEPEFSNANKVENSTRQHEYEEMIHALSKTGQEEHGMDHSRLMLNTSRLPYVFGINVSKKPHEVKETVMVVDESATQVEKANACKVKNNDEILKLFSIKNVLDLDIRIVETANPASKYYSIGHINGLPKYIISKLKVMDNLEDFVKLVPPIGFLMQCTVLRVRAGVDRGLFPTYFLHLQYEDGTKGFLLSARKRKKSKTSNYLICTDPITITKNTMIGKLRSNALGTQFNIFDNGQSPKSLAFDQINEEFREREELGVVKYERNILGFGGPRKFTFYIPAMLNEHQRFVHRPEEEDGDSLIDNFKSDQIGSIIELNNKFPDWDDENQYHVLNFHGRVSKESVKNFQLVHKGQEDYVILQFGRASDINLDLFTLDFRFPLCPLQAMALAITSFDNKFVCA